MPSDEITLRFFLPSGVFMLRCSKIASSCVPKTAHIRGQQAIGDVIGHEPERPELVESGHMRTDENAASFRGGIPFRSCDLNQAVRRNVTFICLRRRNANPTAPIPSSNIAHVAGSGTEADWTSLIVRR